MRSPETLRRLRLARRILLGTAPRLPSVIEERLDELVRGDAAILTRESLREEFARDFCLPMLRANALYEGSYLLGTSIARPVIAKAMMDVARAEGADAIAHGATGKGNDQVRFELTAMAIDPRVRVIAPWREWTLRSRTDCIEYAKKHGKLKRSG